MAGDQEDAINLVVHNLTHGDSASASSQSLLQSGRRLVDVASQNGRWYQPSRNFNTTIFKKSRNSFTFYLTAPSYRVDGCSYNALKKDDIKEWGADLIPPNESEIFSLAELEDFSSTNLDRLLPVSQGATSRQPALPLINSDLIRHARSSKVHTEATEEETNKEHNKKRRRLDACSLYRLIPQPHFYAVPFAIPTLSSIGPVDFFSKSSPKPITPHTSETIDKYLNDRYARAAWIIP
ncbi:hypothetical protein AcV7_002108 [Taiwanofungus camphoratus]|nr:hypothetical protein AcV7_002108 [Antrodia cinnamomea]